MRLRLYAMNAMTAACLLTIGSLWFGEYDNAPGTVISTQDASRNERSTPRSFVLPATPAVAAEQGRHARGRAEDVDLVRCLANLRLLGYAADEASPWLRAQNLEAIQRFQNDRGLQRSGRLDGITARALECK